MADKFEYKSLIQERVPPITEYDIGDFLNEWGAAGWELVSVIETRMMYENRLLQVFYLKRKAIP